MTAAAVARINAKKFGKRLSAKQIAAREKYRDAIAATLDRSNLANAANVARKPGRIVAMGSGAFDPGYTPKSERLLALERDHRHHTEMEKLK